MEKNREFSEDISKTEKEPKEIIHEEIAKLQKPIEQLLSQMEEKIDAGEYNLLIGDDASGRIPTLVFDKVIKEIYSEKGYKPPKTIFIAGSGHTGLSAGVAVLPEKLKEIRELLLRVIPNAPKIKDKKTLIITDTIETGSSLKPLTNVLSSEKIIFDIACIGSGRDSFRRKEFKEILQPENIYFPDLGMKHIPEIYGNPELSGVEKKPSELFSQRESNFNSKLIHEAREDVKVLTERLMEYYKKL